LHYSSDGSYRQGRALNDFAGTIADWAFEQMLRELVEGMATRAGQKILREIWPDIVNG
jgi:hypothetical protein